MKTWVLIIGLGLISIQAHAETIMFQGKCAENTRTGANWCGLSPNEIPVGNWKTTSTLEFSVNEFKPTKNHAEVLQRYLNEAIEAAHSDQPMNPSLVKAIVEVGSRAVTPLMFEELLEVDADSEALQEKVSQRLDSSDKECVDNWAYQSVQCRSMILRDWIRAMEFYPDLAWDAKMSLYAVSQSDIVSSNRRLALLALDYFAHRIWKEQEFAKSFYLKAWRDGLVRTSVFNGRPDGSFSFGTNRAERNEALATYFLENDDRINRDRPSNFQHFYRTINYNSDKQTYTQD